MIRIVSLLIATLFGASALANAIATLFGIELTPYPNLFVEFYRKSVGAILPKLDLPFDLPKMLVWDVLAVWIALAMSTSRGIIVKELVRPTPNLNVAMGDRGRLYMAVTFLGHTVIGMITWPIFFIVLFFHLVLPSIRLLQCKIVRFVQGVLGIKGSNEYEQLLAYVKNEYNESIGPILIVFYQSTIIVTALLLIYFNSVLVSIVAAGAGLL
jgi:hypothetical protein